MNCPVCNSERLSSSGAEKKPDFTRRYLRCKGCGYSYTTIEVEEDYFDKYKKAVMEQALLLVGQKG